MMNDQQPVFVKFVAPCTAVGGKNRLAGEVLQVSRQLARELYRDGLAVPCAAPGRPLAVVGKARCTRMAA